MKKINYKKSNSGFTLIETLIYIALFALIMIGVLVSVYGILGASSRNQTKAMVQEEGSFLLGKIDWALGGKQTASVIHTGTTWTLKMAKLSGASNIDIIIIDSVTDGKMSIKVGSSIEQDLNNSNVTVSCPAVGCFIHELSSADGINPEKVEATFTVNSRTSEGLPYSQDFSTIKYLRK